MRLSTENYYRRDDLTIRIQPKVDFSDRIDAPPAPDLQPAKWLPIAQVLTEQARGQMPFVIMKGKPVALERGGDYGLCPAGIGKFMKANGLTYSANDVTWYTEDITTGQAVTAAVTYSKADIANAILERGWVTEDMAVAEGATAANLPRTTNAALATPADDTEIDAIIDAFISPAIGWAQHPIFPYMGRAFKGDFKFTNWMPQHKTAFKTAHVLQMPHMVAAQASQLFDHTTAPTNGGSGASASVTISAAGEMIGAGQFIDATNMAATSRFSAMGVEATDNLAFLRLTLGTLAAVRVGSTDITSTQTGLLSRQVGTIAKVLKAGDYWVDEQGGGLVVYSNTGAGTGWAPLVGVTSVTFSFYQYAATTASSLAEVGLYGDVRPGDRLTYDTYSNLVKASATTPEDEIVGILYAFKKERVEGLSRGGLGRVRTGYHDAGASNKSKMPGSATDGYTDLITFAEELAADQIGLVIFQVTP